MSTTLITREQFEYSILTSFGGIAYKFAQSMLLAEISEHTIMKFQTMNSCVNAIRHYFRRYDGNIPPTDDSNCFKKSEIEDIVQLYNNLAETNFWYEFPEDEN